MLEAVQQKICLLGDVGVGKTSLVRRFVSGIFEDKYLTTVGVNISRKSVNLTLPGRTQAITLNFMMWDLNGGAKFDKMFSSYCGGSNGAILVCDLTRHESLEKLDYYARNFKQLRPAGQLIFVGNKSDLPSSEWRVLPQDLARYAQTYTAPHYLTSAKTGATVEEMFNQMGQALLAAHH